VAGRRVVAGSAPAVRTPVRQRRRGAVLEHALLAAAWDELVEVGYAGFTIERVATRARTSTPVLYRRWPDRWRLAIAALVHHAEQNPLRAPDTGSLRTDLIALMRDSSAKRAEVAVLFSLRMAEFFHDAHSSPAELREMLFRRRPALVEEVYARAVARGEIDPDRLTTRVKAVPFDLLRNEITMTLGPVPRRVIEEIVDDVVLPLLDREEK
jgi:AcrR family transcriptional regulator